MKTLKYFLLIILSMCILLSGCAGTPAGIIDAEPIFSGTLSSYAAMDSAELKTQCEGNYIEINGTVTYYGHPLVYIGSPADGIMFVCYLASDFPLNDIEIGKSVILRGLCSNVIADSVHLKSCVIPGSNTSGTAAAPSSPSASAAPAPSAAPAHIHGYYPATCTSPATCAECGSTDGAPLGHSFVNGTCDMCGSIEQSQPNTVPQGQVLGTEEVWIPTNGGTKYHTNADCSNMIAPELVTKTEAAERGFEPCEKCY